MGGIVCLVGAGPGNPDLISVRGLECLRRAQVVVYDRLVSRSLLAETDPGCELIYAGKEGGGPHAMPQADISQLLVDRARAGLTVCRLKGGDPFVFGRGGEEAMALHRAGILFEVVPGVTAGVGATAFAGIPVTHRGVASAVAFITGHEAAERGPGLPGTDLAAGATTLVWYMGLTRAAAIRDELLRRGCAPATPAALVQWGTRAEQRVAVGTLAELPELASELSQPAVVIVGGVVALREVVAWAERRPLFGRRVLLLAHRGSAPHAVDEVAASVRDRGGEPWIFPRRAAIPSRRESELLAQELAEGGIHLALALDPLSISLLCNALGGSSLLRPVPFFAGSPAVTAALAERDRAIRVVGDLNTLLQGHVPEGARMEVGR